MLAEAIKNSIESDRILCVCWPVVLSFHFILMCLFSFHLFSEKQNVYIIIIASLFRQCVGA